MSAKEPEPEENRRLVSRGGARFGVRARPRTALSTRTLSVVGDVADWNGMTVCSGLESSGLLHPRVWRVRRRPETKTGNTQERDMGLLEGVLSSVTYRDLWGQFPLYICLQNCTFTVTILTGLNCAGAVPR